MPSIIRSPRLLFAIGLVLCAVRVFAAVLETLPLAHRSAEEILPQVQALLEPGGAATGRDFNLFVRTSPRNLEQIRAAVQALDVPARRLIISLRRTDAAQKLGAGGTGQSWSAASSGAREQRVQTLEGARAVLASGHLAMLPWRQLRYGADGQVLETTLVWREVSDGFSAVARLRGERVTVEIEPVAQELGGPDAPRSLRLTTTVSGRLGEWLPLGSDGVGAPTADSGQYRAGGQREQHLWLRVDAAP